MRDDDDVPNGTRWACFRHSVIGHLLASPPPVGELGSALDALASRTWVHPISHEPVQCGRSTIERWLSAEPLLMRSGRSGDAPRSVRQPSAPGERSA
jgi:hypothetical protein